MGERIPSTEVFQIKRKLENAPVVKTTELHFSAFPGEINFIFFFAVAHFLQDR